MPASSQNPTECKLQIASLLLIFGFPFFYRSTDVYYAPTSTLLRGPQDNKKTPSFGVGERSNQRLLSTERSKPGPTAYTLKSEFESNRESRAYLARGKGFSFYEPHCKYSKVYSKYQEPPKGRGPDAGLYYIKSFVDILKTNNKKFSLGQRDLSSQNRSTSREGGPAPTQYDAFVKTGLNPKGQYPVSTIANLRNNYKFGGKSRRDCKFEVDAVKQASASPDPGAYHDGLIRHSNNLIEKMGCISYTRSPAKTRYEPLQPK